MHWIKADYEDKNFMRSLWEFTDAYFAEIISDKSVLKYFTGSKYRNAVIKYVKKKRIVMLAENTCGLNAICFYDAQDIENIFLMEFCVAKNLRGKGYGKKLYFDLTLSAKIFRHAKFHKKNLRGKGYGKKLYFDFENYLP